MKLKNKILSGKQILEFVLFKKRKPTAVRINLNNKCVYQCEYCNVWNTPTKEMTTEQVINLIDELKEMGTQRISFSGGEPMLRKDIGKIISYTKSKGISPSINTTGFSFKKRINEIKDLNLIKFSLDGKKDYHDPIRGKGTFEKTMKSIEIAHKNNLKFSFATTLTNKSTNIPNARFMFKLAKKYDTFVAFQPLKEMHKGVKNLSPVSPKREQYKKFIKFLMKMKQSKKWRKHIRNSNKGLRHVENWPRYKKLKCNAGNVFIIVMPDGDVVPCDRIKDKYKESIPNYLEKGMKESFNNLPKVKCAGCGFCGALELNYLSNMKGGVLSEINRIVK